MEAAAHSFLHTTAESAGCTSVTTVTSLGPIYMFVYSYRIYVLIHALSEVAPERGVVSPYASDESIMFEATTPRIAAAGWKIPFL